MTQDDKESLEREVSALRGQVALLQRNNKIFSDRERNELKEDLDLANKRCTNCKNQLEALKRSLEYEQVENLNRQIRELKVEAEELRIELREFHAAEPAGSDEDSDVSSNERQAKYARLLELEEEAEELNSKMKGLEEDVKDRDVMVEELHHQLDSVAKQHREEAMKLEKKMKKREEELSEEIVEHERQIDELKDVIKMKQANLQRKTDGLEECEGEIDKLQKELQRKQKTIEKLQWEIEALQRENQSLKERIEKLKAALKDTGDPSLLELTLSPINSFRSSFTAPPTDRPSSRASIISPRTPAAVKVEVGSRSVDSLNASKLNTEETENRKPRQRSESYQGDGQPTSALREGINEARQTVRDIGVELDTPRTSRGKLSPDARSRFSSPFTSPTRELKREDASPRKAESSPKLRRESDVDSVSSSSESSTEKVESDGIGEQRKSGNISLVTLPSENVTMAGNVHTDTDGHESAVDVIPDGSKTVQDDTKTLLPESSIQIPIFEDRSVTSYASGRGRHASSSSERSVINDEPATSHKKSKSFLTSENESTSSSSVSNNSLEKNDSEVEIKTPSKQGKKKQISDPEALEVKPIKVESTVVQSSNNLTDASTVSAGSLLPDDRPTLIQEVTKAREEARKWFHEVTQSDRDKRQLDRRLGALESEISRLKTVEDNYETMLRDRKFNDVIARDVEAMREEAEAANRKAEEAKEKNAILRAHLLDKQLDEQKEAKKNENKEQPKTSTPLPLSEVQEVTSPNYQKSPMRSGMTSPQSRMTSPKLSPIPSAKQLEEIKDGFEYIASNFASLTLKKHGAELALAPEKAKVSHLKRKCLERDQILAKLVLRLKKKRADTSLGVNDDDSTTSSVGFESILSKADRLLRSNDVTNDFSDTGRHIDVESAENIENKSYSDVSRTSPLIKALTEKSPLSQPRSPSHRIYVAKHDFAPANKPPSPAYNESLPITHSLLPDLPLLAGDTVVAIGNPDERESGKFYQLAEVRGKIGFVPLAHLVAAEQVEGMQAFVLEKGKNKRKKSASSSPEKIVDLYKKLEQAHLIVADKIERSSKKSKKPFFKNNNVMTSPARRTSSLTSSSIHESESDLSISIQDYLPSKNKREKSTRHRDDVSDPSYVTSESSYVSKASTKRSQRQRNQSNNKTQATRPSRDRKREPRSNECSSYVRPGTPTSAKTSLEKSRSSSLPPRSSSKHHSIRSDVSTPAQFISGKPPLVRDDISASLSHSDFRTSQRSMTSPMLTSPQPPTFLVIEKTMGNKSMIICWTPPVLDLISRSNDVPVIGYEISVDRVRKIQISGAYTNKAILGDLNLSKTFTIEVRTVSSVGTRSKPSEVLYTPNQSPRTPVTSPNLMTSHDPMTSQNTSPKERFTTSTPNVTPRNSHTEGQDRTRRATALYDYDPAVDSPYKSHHEELRMQQGENVIVVNPSKADGFCDVQIGSKRGRVPVAFLLSDDDISIDSISTTSSSRHRGKYRSREYDVTAPRYIPATYSLH
nr:uncharacterized protein LOC104266398 [Ciona intestinalis]|eukprot:XP_026693441.1 uncharacterized protein LOC104266398 [Ciona intestinalis]